MPIRILAAVALLGAIAEFSPKEHAEDRCVILLPANTLSQDAPDYRARTLSACSCSAPRRLLSTNARRR
jgi:hypothetical protein